MATVSDDPYIQEIEAEMQKEQAERPKKGWNQLGGGTQLALIGAFAVLSFLTYIGRLAPRKGIAGLVVLAIIVVLLLNTNRRRDPLDKTELMIRLNNQIQAWKYHPIGDKAQIGNAATVHISLTGGTQHFGGDITKATTKVTIIEDEFEPPKERLVIQDVYTGKVLDWQDYPEGVTGRERRDLQYIFPPQVQNVKKMREFLKIKGGP